MGCHQHILFSSLAKFGYVRSACHRSELRAIETVPAGMQCAAKHATGVFPPIGDTATPASALLRILARHRPELSPQYSVPVAK